MLVFLSSVPLGFYCTKNTLDFASSGKIIINGERIDSLGKNQLACVRNSTIGFLFHFHYLLSEFIALENILIPYQMCHGATTKESFERAEVHLDMVGIAALKNNKANKMAVGKLQRAAIARALINNPPIILADEPTGNLDSESSEGVYELFRDINKKFGSTFIIVTYDDKIAEKTDRIIEIRDGRIKMDLKNMHI